MRRAFVDSDIFLDVIFNRIEFAEDSSKIFDLASQAGMEIFTTSICLSNIFYLTSKQLGKVAAKQILIELKPLFKIAPTTDTSIEQALQSSFADVEDAFQYFSAVENNLDVIITRNLKDYTTSILPVFTPTEFLSTLN